LARSIRIFASSSPDLASERECLGQAVAELPISVRCDVHHTPSVGEDVDEVLSFVDDCDVYILVLGADFAAPMGLEWNRARLSRRKLIAFRKRVLRSPSAQKLVREAGASWHEFETPSDLKALVGRQLARLILDQGEEFGLHLGDVESLVSIVEEGDQEAPVKPERRHGAGRSGVILGRGTNGTADTSS
jgi:hypothetical protein